VTPKERRRFEDTEFGLHRCFCGLRKHLGPSQLSPVLLYGSEMWVLTKKEENRLLVFEKKVLRTIYGSKIEDGVHRSRYNFELDKEFNSPNVICVVKSNRLRYAAAHDKRCRRPVIQRVLYTAMPEGRRNQRRPKSRWA
jgi:hypothetical protein